MLKLETYFSTNAPVIAVIILPAKSTLHASELAKSPSPVDLNDYQRLKQILLFSTLALVAVLTVPIGWVYGINIGASFALGGVGGLVYLRMLSRSVDSLGTNNGRLGKARLGVFIALMIIAGRWQNLQILPTFLGFLTYKLAILGFMLQDIFKEVKE